MQQVAKVEAGFGYSSFTTGVAVFCIFSSINVSKAELAYIMSAITDVIPFISNSLTEFADLQILMVASQRIISYTKLECERDMVLDHDKEKDDWPREGKIEFKNVNLKYPDQPKLTLEDINF